MTTKEHHMEQTLAASKRSLNKERFKFGFANILYQGEEAGIGAVHTITIRTLGGNSLHLGICGGLSSIGSLVQWIGTPLLKRFQSNRRAMNATLVAGAVGALLIAGALLTGLLPGTLSFPLWAYIVLSFFCAGVTGISWNIETNWIGDLVPKEILGWFSSVKWIVAVLGVLCFMLIFGKFADLWPNLYCYAGIFLFIAFSQILAVALMGTIPDRTPKTANLIAGGGTPGERINYRSVPFWSYICFSALWSGGRVPMYTFAVPYMLDQFNCSVTQVALIVGIQSVISIVMLFVLGKLSDRFGNRLLLLLVSGTMAICMLLWVASAWWGLAAVITFQFVNGLAGYTHTLLSTNYGLEIFPEKGRAGYFGISRFIMSVFVISVSMGAGYFLTTVRGWSMEFGGTVLNSYHLLFSLSALMTALCVVPLLIAGKKVVREF